MKCMKNVHLKWCVNVFIPLLDVDAYLQKYRLCSILTEKEKKLPGERSHHNSQPRAKESFLPVPEHPLV